MSEEPRHNKGRGLVDRKLAEAPSHFIAGRPKAALLFCLLVVLCSFFPGSFIVVVSIVSICHVYDSRIEATYPSIPVARFAFSLCFIRFVSIVRSCFI